MGERRVRNAPGSSSNPLKRRLLLAKALDLQLGVTDLPLVIQDKQFDAQGRLRYRPNAHEAMTHCSLP